LPGGATNASAVGRVSIDSSLPAAEAVGMLRPRSMRILRLALVFVALFFGLATLVAGARVLAGSDPGYVVFEPLLVYNFAMGFAYIAAGVVAWRSLGWGRRAALAIFVLNLAVLAAIAWLYSNGGAVAVESVRAMILRTTVWLALFLGFAWIYRRSQ